MNQSSATARLSYASLPLAASPTTDCTCPCTQIAGLYDKSQHRMTLICAVLAAFGTEPLLLGTPFSRRWYIDNWQKRRLEDRTGGSTTPPRHAPSSPAGTLDLVLARATLHSQCTGVSTGQPPSASPQRKGASGKGRSRRDGDGESSASEGRNDGADLLRLLPRKADATTNEAELTSALGEALTQINTAHKCFKSQPNRASKLYFTAAKCACCSVVC